jgi:hypothetical protein
VRNFIICTHPQISLSKSSQGGRGMWHAWERREKCKRFWWETRRKETTEGVGGKMGSEWILGRLIGLGGCGLDSTVSGQGPVVGCCECGDEPSGSCTMDLVS